MNYNNIPPAPPEEDAPQSAEKAKTPQGNPYPYPPQGNPYHGYPPQGDGAQQNYPYGYPPQGDDAPQNHPYGYPPQDDGVQQNYPYGYPPQGDGAQQNYPYGYPPQGDGAQQNHPYGYPPQGNSYYGAQPHNPQGAYQPAVTTIDYSLYTKKKSIRRLGNSIGLPLCLFFIISLAASLLAQTCAMLLLGVDETFRLFSDPNVLYVMSAAITVLALTLPFLIPAAYSRVRWRDIVSFQRVGASTAIPVIMLGIGACAVSNMAASYFASILDSLTGITPESSMIDFGSGPLSFVLMLLCVGILPAVLEEFAFRGVVLGTLRLHLSDGTSVFLSAALFGLMHGNLQQIPFAFGVGLVLAYAAVYTKSLIPSMIIHGVNNSLSVILTFASDPLSPMMEELVAYLYIIVTLLIGICGFIVLAKTDPHPFRLSDERSETAARDVGWFCGSGWIVTFFVLCGLEILSVQFPELFFSLT